MYNLIIILVWIIVINPVSTKYQMSKFLNQMITKIICNIIWINLLSKIPFKIKKIKKELKNKFENNQNEIPKPVININNKNSMLNNLFEFFKNS